MYLIVYILTVIVLALCPFDGNICHNKKPFFDEPLFYRIFIFAYIVAPLSIIT